MRHHILFLLLCLSALLRAQERLDSVSAVVIDAETTEPVPYVSVYVSLSRGTISNYDGEFSLLCLPIDVVRISCIGYQRVGYQAKELPDTIRLKPIASTLREITVVGTDDILYRVVRKMLKEAKKYKKAESNYFFRLSTQYPGTDELAEAFLSARSCVQMRDITFHSGNRGLLKENKIAGPDLKGLGRTNLHIFLRLAPVLAYYNDWDYAVVPSDIALSRRGKLYEVSTTSFREEDGTEITKIHVTGKPASASYTMLEGTLYIDREKCQLRRFDGRMRGLFLRIYDNARRRTTIDTVGYAMHVDYRHDHGYTEIDNMSGTILKEQVMLRYLLFNLGDKELTFSKSKRVDGNMLQTIDAVGYDSTLWDMADVVKRTKQEERVAFQGSNFRMKGKSHYDVAPSPQEVSTNRYLQDAIRRLKGNVMQLNRGLPQIERNTRRRRL